MRSSGGVATLAEAAAHPAPLLVSGPAAGVVGAARVARRAGFANAIAFDMGGTSTDVCLIPGGRAARAAERAVGGLPIRLPTRRPAHGRRRRRLDRLASTRAARSASGPRARAPTPGRRATGAAAAPTVTDANLLLGRLPAELPGGLELDRDGRRARARAASTRRRSSRS